jgi:hypothetical protein
MDVRPGRIDDLNRVGAYLKVGELVEFIVENTEQFPYYWAVPLATSLDDNNLPKPTSLPVKRRTKKQFRLQLLLSGFGTDDLEIVCDGYDCSSSGYYYFYDNKESGGRYMIGYFPVSRTAIHQIEEIETEY